MLPYRGEGRSPVVKHPPRRRRHISPPLQQAQPGPRIHHRSLRSPRGTLALPLPSLSTATPVQGCPTPCGQGSRPCRGLRRLGCEFCCGGCRGRRSEASSARRARDPRSPRRAGERCRSPRGASVLGAGGAPSRTARLFRLGVAFRPSACGGDSPRRGCWSLLGGGSNEGSRTCSSFVSGGGVIRANRG